MNNIFLIHGSYGKPYKNWLPWLQKELSKRKRNSIVPSFLLLTNKIMKVGVKSLKSYLKIGYITEETTFITHSLGGIFIIKFLIENKVKIKKLITVAGFNNLKFDDDYKLYESFYMNDEKLQEIVTCCKERICIYSNDDPYIAEHDASHFANHISAKKVVIKKAGHFNEKAGYKEFKEILKYIDEVDKIE